MEDKVYPKERDVRGEPPRLGIFVCDCGTNIAKVVDVKQVVAYAKRLPGVTHAAEETFACSVDSVGHMAETIRNKGLNRVIVAACTPRTHEPVFQNVLREAGLNPYLFEFANIREHCSLVHMTDKRRATEKAKDLVRMAAARATLLEPLYQVSYDVNRSALVIGGGVSGMVAALSLANQGIKVHLIEKTDVLGGLSVKIPETLEGGDVRALIKDLIGQVRDNALIDVSTGAELVEYSGYVGRFTSRVKVGPAGALKEIEHGATIVAVGAEESTPQEYLYGEDKRVMTLLEFDEVLTDADRLKDCNGVVFIQCVGSRNDERPYCSRVCCSHSVKSALKLKEFKPEMDVYVLYRDMRTYGFREDYYKKASDQGVIFIRSIRTIHPTFRPLKRRQGHSRLTATEPMLGQRIEIECGMVALLAPPPFRGRKQSTPPALKVPLNEDGFFMKGPHGASPRRFCYGRDLHVRHCP